MKILNKKEGEIYKILSNYIKYKQISNPIYIETLDKLCKYFPTIVMFHYFNPKIYKNKNNKHIINIWITNPDNYLEALNHKTYYI